VRGARSMEGFSGQKSVNLEAYKDFGAFTGAHQ